MGTATPHKVPETSSSCPWEARRPRQATDAPDCLWVNNSLWDFITVPYLGPIPVPSDTYSHVTLSVFIPVNVTRT